MRKYKLPGLFLGDNDLVERYGKNIAGFLNTRGIKSIEELESNSSIDGDYSQDIFDIKTAVAEILKAVKSKKKICIYGDYDVDGMVSSSILWQYLYRILKADATIYIPSRHDEGYGLNEDAVQELIKKGTNLIITVDCGIRDYELIAKYRDKATFIVTDHHQPAQEIPNTTVVHPLYPGKEAKNKHTSGSVVSWKLVRELEVDLGNHDFSDSVIDLVGLTLITDMMPIIGENRVILKRGLQKATTHPSLSIKTILAVSGAKFDSIDTYHFGFIIGPRLNAAGRIGNPYESLRLISSEKEDFVKEIAGKLEKVNKERQDILTKSLREADETKYIINDKIILAYNENWDDGIIGLVAGRLLQKYAMPTLVLTKDKSGELKGSARSISGLNITELLEGFSNNLSKYGGHESAAGFSSHEEFSVFLEHFRDYVSKNLENYNPTEVIDIDMKVDANEVTQELLDVVAILAPFGQKNPEPLFVLDATLESFQLVGQDKNHASCSLQGTGQTIKGIYFNVLAQLSLMEQGKRYLFLGKPKLEEFRGIISISFHINKILQKEEILSV